MGEHKVVSHKRYSENAVKNIDNWSISTEEKIKVREFIKAYEGGDITNRKPRNPEALIERLLQFLRPALESLKENPELKDTTEFKNKLFQNKISSRTKNQKKKNQKIAPTNKYNGKPYSTKTKIGILSTLANYLDWRYPNSPGITKPLKIRIEKDPDDEYETFSIPEEADKLRDNCGDIKRRGVLALLTAGIRVEEAMNIRYGVDDIKILDNFVQLKIRKGTSKTKGRTIRIYYSNALPDILEFIKIREKENIKPGEPLIDMNYRSIRDWIGLLGKKTLNKKITPHSYRHSVATWLAPKLNRQEFAYYFGWSFSSNMPDRYINREGFVMKDSDAKIENENIAELKKFIKEKEVSMDIKNEQLNKKVDKAVKHNEVMVKFMQLLASKKVSPKYKQKLLLGMADKFASLKEGESLELKE